MSEPMQWGGLQFKLSKKPNLAIFYVNVNVPK